MGDRFAEGTVIPAVVTGPITRTDLVRYAGASGDFNPIHHDDAFSQAAGNPTVFGHGMLTAGLVGRCITDFVGGVARLRRFKVRFATRVWPGDVITCTGRVTRRYDAEGEARIDGEVVALNQKGEATVSGSFTAAVPG